VNKILIIVILVILIITIVAIVFYNINEKITLIPWKTKFNLKNYDKYVNNYYDGRNIGEVDTEETAIYKAKELWLEKYGENDTRLGTKVEFDKKNKCWYIRGTLPSDTIGGVPHALIKTDGTVLAVWHDQ